MRQIELNSKKYPGLVALVDDNDYEQAMEFKWNILDSNKNGKLLYATRGSDHGNPQLLHAFLMGYGIDHINGNGLDCRRENLRPATRKDQARNRRFNSNKTGFMGVYLVSPDRPKPYQASLRIDGRNKSLGYYATPEEASTVREAKARELFGAFYREVT